MEQVVLVEDDVMTAASPNAIASSNSPVCEGQDIQLSASGGSIYSWTGPLSSNPTNKTPPSECHDRNGRIVPCDRIQWRGMQGCCLGGGTTGRRCWVVECRNLNQNCPGDTLFLYASGGSSYLWIGPFFSSTLQNPFIPFAGPENRGCISLRIPPVQGCVLNDDQCVHSVGPFRNGQPLHL